jgi:hypothetical protein
LQPSVRGGSAVWDWRVGFSCFWSPSLAFGGSATIGSSGTAPRPPSTLTVIKEAEDVTTITFADGKLAWTPLSGGCASAVRVFDLATRHRTAMRSCDGMAAPGEVAVAGGAVLWLTFIGGNTESVEKVYSASGGSDAAPRVLQ